ncbi:MAG: DUF4942 domain-containing protein [Lentisphaeria bacterium]|nr:DUF4942 domain-containing protein [Lentisphaeria bacterium]
MSTTTLIKELKEAGEDYELYPTSPEMIKAIWEHRRKPYSDGSGYNVKSFGKVLDIGCGTENFKKYVDEFNKPFIKCDEDGRVRSNSDAANIHDYYVIEKSKILIDKLAPETIVLGTDFQQTTLIDKPVDTIFCNPPYSEYEDWTVKIIKESVCKDIYLIIPQRWKNSEKINIALQKYITTPYCRYRDTFDDLEKVTVLGSFDFMDAERSARAKVDVIYINKSDTRKESAFDTFFDEVFGMEDKKGVNRFKEEQEKINTELSTGKNKIEILCDGYTAAQQQLFEHFQVITNLDADILDTIGIQKDKVKSALQSKIEGLKNVYWNAAFDCLEEITSRLTSKSRGELLSCFEGLKSVDFNAPNIYALIVWVIKNSNQYFTSQMLDFFFALSSPENVRNYKSNKRVFEHDGWGYRNKKHDHYTLDYRIICTQYALPGERNNYYYDRQLEREMRHKISDICTVANNLGFPHGYIDFPPAYGKKGIVYMADDKTVLFEFKCYFNNNVHIKLNKEFIKALNVVVAKELGWIHSKQDIAKEFTDEMAAGAEKYFDNTVKLEFNNIPLLTAAENI